MGIEWGQDMDEGDLWRNLRITDRMDRQGGCLMGLARSWTDGISELVGSFLSRRGITATGAQSSSPLMSSANSASSSAVSMPSFFAPPPASPSAARFTSSR